MAAFAKAVKGGYDNEFVAGPPKSLECPVCLLVLREPHVISCCGHHFCRPCIERVLQDKKPCPLCNAENFTVMLHKGVQREVNTLLVRCPQKQLGCGWEGELGQLQRHVSIADGDCGYVKVECIHHCGERFLRHLADAHKATCSKLPLEVQLSTAMKKLDVALSENRSLKEEVAQLKMTNMAESQKVRCALQAVQADNEARKAESDDLRRQIMRLEANLLQLESRQSSVPPVTFRVCNSDHYKREDLRWDGPSFYSHNRGYKMRVVVYCKGVGVASGNHVSLCVCLEQGEYDDRLRWPFQGRVIVQAFNRDLNKWEQDYIIVLTADNVASQRPRPFAQRTYGPYRYISHLKLKQYSGDANILRIRVVRTELDP